jgi:hypothetical protein
MEFVEPWAHSACGLPFIPFAENPLLEPKVKSFFDIAGRAGRGGICLGGSR